MAYVLSSEFFDLSFIPLLKKKKELEGNIATFWWGWVLD